MRNMERDAIFRHRQAMEALDDATKQLVEAELKVEKATREVEWVIEQVASLERRMDRG